MELTTGQLTKQENEPTILLFCADQSLRCPGFAQLEFDKETKKVKLLRKSNVDNHGARKAHGQMLAEIAQEIKSYLKSAEGMVLVRERGFYRTPNETIALAKVAGIADLYAYSYKQATFDEITPVSIKKTVTGNHKADKDEVARCVEKFVGVQQYKTDDESDAVAVGIAWLIQNGYLEKI